MTNQTKFHRKILKFAEKSKKKDFLKKTVIRLLGPPQLPEKKFLFKKNCAGYYVRVGLHEYSIMMKIQMEILDFLIVRFLQNMALKSLKLLVKIHMLAIGAN